MAQLPSDPPLGGPALATGAQPAARTILIAAAWAGTLLLSKLPLVIARDLLGTDIAWMELIWLGAAVLLVMATFAWPALKPLRGYFAIMGVILLVTAGISPLITESAIWQRLVAGQSPMVALFADKALLALLTLVVLVAVLLMGVGRRDAFLTPGNLTAPVRGLALPGGRRLSWAVFGTVVSLLLATLFFLFLWTQDPAVGAGLASALPWAPLILAGAALNAFGEEGMYRAAPLAVLLPAVGARQAIWLTAVWFGFGHYYGGIPSGPMGLVQSGLLAVLMGKAMVDTRGLGWPWIIHVAIDSVIFTAIAATS